MIAPPLPPMIRPSPTAAAPTPIIATLVLSPVLVSLNGRAGPGTLAPIALVKPAGAMRGPDEDVTSAVSAGPDVAMGET